MFLLPAIDLLGGKVVRLAQGDYDRVTVYSDDPVAQARLFEEQGASWLHVVDLDGARDGVPGNIDIIEKIVSETSLSVEVGGGIRSMETCERYAQAGASHMVLGTALIRDPDFARAAAEKYGDKIVAGIDARGGEVAVSGWLEGSSVPADQLARDLMGFGIGMFVYTDISRDGMRSGIDAEAYRLLAERSGADVIASGGISSIADLIALKETGAVWGAIAGRALYEGEFTVAEAIAALEEGEA